MTVVKLEQDPALQLAPEAHAGARAEELSLPPSYGDEEDEEYDEEEEDEEETDSDSEGNGGAPPLKKGPWTPEEDKRLKDYIEAHGEGNWNQVQRNAGLNRCGKSCRLRWANHLRPDLKKGPFDAEEVDQIIRFHIMWGNKWAKMASLLPGRTDNEIKNYWNTRLKRHQRAGLPIYPEYLLSRVPDQDMNCHTPDESRGKKRSNELPQEKVVGMDDLVGDFMVFQHLDYGKDPVVPTNPLKRHASTGDLLCVQIPVNTEKTFYSNDLNYVLTKCQSMPLGSAISSGYPIFDGNLSTSGTIHGSTKTELPSFQCPKYDFSNGWLLQCPSASIEQQIDTFIQSPESMSSHNTGLLGTIINKVNGDCEPDACRFTEIQDSNSPSGGSDAIFTLGKCYPDANLSVAGMPGTLLEASFLNDDSLLSKDQSHLYPSGSLFDEQSCDKPLIDAGQWFDSTAWKSVPGACNMPDFPGP